MAKKGTKAREVYQSRRLPPRLILDRRTSETQYLNDLNDKLENINWVRNGRDIELSRALNTLLYGLRKSRGVCWDEN